MTLASQLGVSDKCVKKYLKNLEKKGGLYICKRYNKTTKKQLSNRYYVIGIHPFTGEFETHLLKPILMRYPDKKIYVDSNDIE